MEKRKGPPKGTGGRPKWKKPEDLRIHHTIRIAPETDAIITSARKPDESYSATIDRLVQETTTMATRITLRHQTESDLFDGADAATLATVDVPASIAAFESAWAARVWQVWPEAKIGWSHSQLTHAVVDFGTEDYNAEAQAEEEAQWLAEELFDDGNIWMVEAVTA